VMLISINIMFTDLFNCMRVNETLHILLL